MRSFDRVLSNANIDRTIQAYSSLVDSIAPALANLSGLDLLEWLKRGRVNGGPYPDVALFEAANRILSDLVILHGVKHLLNHNVFPFPVYKVEYGTEHNRGFDICAEANGLVLIGEAFNVAESFFQAKKWAMLKKLRDANVRADYKIVLFNHDAARSDYEPETGEHEYFVMVNIHTGNARVVPDPALWDVA